MVDQLQQQVLKERKSCGLLALFVYIYLLLLLSSSYVSGQANVIGAGTTNVEDIFTSFAEAYRFNKDTVTITYQSTTPISAVTSYIQGQVDFACVDGVLPSSFLDTNPNLALLPLVATALVPVYHLGTSSNLVLDGDTLARIWLGEISHWDHPAIVTLNRNLSLPHLEITLAYRKGTALGSQREVWNKAMSAFNSNFQGAIDAVNGDLSLLIPTNRSFISDSLSGRVNYVKNTDGSMTFMTQQEALKNGMIIATMRNRANSLVTPSLASIQSAMDGFRNETHDTVAIEIVNAPGTASWPISYITFIVVNKSISAADCSVPQELLLFLSWVQLNDQAVAAANALNYAALSNTFRKNMIDSFGRFTCNSEQAFNINVLTGIGSYLNIYTAFAEAYESQTFKVKYFPLGTAAGKVEIAAGDADFAGVSLPLTAAEQQNNPDLRTFTLVSVALAPVMNIPELRAVSTDLILTFEVLAGITLNQITYWNDSRIAALNPKIADLLPGQPIILIQSLGVTATIITDEVITLFVPDYKNYVPVPGSVVWPATKARGTVSSKPVPIVKATPYSMTFWGYNEVISERSLSVPSLINRENQIVRPNQENIISAVDNTEHAENKSYIPSAPGKESWPMVGFAYLAVYKSKMPDCNRAKALVNWVLWTQTNPDAEKIAIRSGTVVTSRIPALKRQALQLLVEVTCNGQHVSSLYGCVSDGVLCSDAGTCLNNQCKCQDNKTGEFCQFDVSNDSSSHLAVILGVVIPVSSAILLLLLCAVIVIVVVVQRRRRKRDDWEIDYNELDIKDQLGAGGFGEVHRAMWKGTDVAVKVMAADQLTKEMQRNFQEEVRVMTSLRHPNVVLFMAACTRPPHLCIVMEYMALGSLYDLLHNELIPDLPFQLRVKVAYQTAKGMHFLHSSGIVHRDLKSLNILLDSKWNAKVSDFGLTKFKNEIKQKGTKNALGTVHWTAPEILNESMDADFMLADVYSFGVVLWELLTRMQPYYGLSPATIAVAVIRDGIRPEIPDNVDVPSEYLELVHSCWHVDPTMRPAFLEVMTRLSGMMEENTSGSHSGSSSSMGTSTKPTHTWAASGSTHSHGSASEKSNGEDKIEVNSHDTVVPPQGEVTIVFSDITRAASLWEFNPLAMRDATILHNQILRSVLKKHQGYEVMFLKDRNSGEGSFCMAFQQTRNALEWCIEAQQELVAADWPEELLKHEGAAEEWGDTDDRVIFKGLRVRMGVHVGKAQQVRDPMTRKFEYVGPAVNVSARITAMSHGGQVLLSGDAQMKIENTELCKEKGRFQLLGNFEILESTYVTLYELKVRNLEARFFGGVTTKEDRPSSSSGSANTTADKLSMEMDTSFGSSKKSEGGIIHTTVGEGMQFQEDHFLTSANLCRWIIDFTEIQLSHQVGKGSYGVVFRGKWKGVEVAVKKLVKQKLDERVLLEFRAEMAFLSELHHPNIVLFIGACVKRPNLCIVTEFVKQGSLKDILRKVSTKLVWIQRLRMLRSAALGINYLHSLSPTIIHRDLKSSNLLVDENWNVKVADFGFARIKEENVTMTQCGTPSWTAPEIIRGEKYSESADVYSFGIIMWEVLTRKEPYAGRNFMGVSLDVLEGQRPQVPSDCPVPFAKLMKKCWHASPDKRPAISDVLLQLDQMLLAGSGDSALQLHGIDQPQV